MPLAGSRDAATPQVRNSAFVEQISDITTTSTTFVDLGNVSITMVTAGAPCVCFFSCSASNATMNNVITSFRLMVDGVAARGTKFTYNTTGGGTTLTYRTGTLAAGSHIFKIQWSVAAGTGRIRALTQIDEGANLLVEEIDR